jgi:hypothetical protein
MGFFKDLKNKITGGAATVRVSVPSVKRGQSVPVKVQATAKANGKVASVYLLVRGVEGAEWKENGERVHNSKLSFDTKVQISGAQDIKEGETYDWEGAIELPHTAQPTFRGALIHHTWEIQAGLDMPGNDPDSGWQPFEVQ